MSATASPTPSFPLNDAEAQTVQSALSGLNDSQLLWVSGYAAGLAARSTAPAAAAPVAGSTYTILYGSQTGNGEAIAKALAAEATRQGFEVRLVSMADYKPASLKRESVVSFIVSTHGEGDPPDDAELLHEFLLSSKAPQLSDLKFNVLALGDSSYVNFCQTGRDIDTRLAELGAERLGPIVECDVDYQSDADAWSADTLALLPKPSQQTQDVSYLRAVPDAPVFDRKSPFLAEVLVNQKITGRDSTRDIHHVELSLAGSGIRYEPGDALAVLPVNPPQLVNEFLDALKLDGSTTISIGDEDVELRKSLDHRLEITSLSLVFLKAWAEIANSDEIRALLEDSARVELGQFVDQHQVIDVVLQYPASVDAQTFADSLRKLEARSYSISSGFEANPDEVHLTVAAVRYEAFGREHVGAASSYLVDRVTEGDQVAVYLVPNSRFRLPQDPAARTIMIGPGTGVAPFRAFVEERAESGASGENWLFFGARNFSSDFLYQLEWHRHLKQGNLQRMDVAFSRDQASKIYVQDRIRDKGSEVSRWIDEGAHVYVCGDAKRMAADVHDALRDVLVKHGGLDEEQAEARLKELRRSGRYQKDVY
ncbi:MAG: assimilatory sulfite reductase (NADPH) flavoprotein subunit [Woeseiaceae bacterium]|nr:assimilatory sulfite reductase (NADPH) flavoprotein subunit [Woeseiaceae bacterium]